MRIVLVDDHVLLREGLRLRLQHEPGYVIVGEAGDATEAYEVVAKTLPDIVLMDLNLPGESGLDVTERIRATWPQIRVLVLTGEVTDAMAHGALRAGAAGFLRKSEASAELVRAIEVVMQGETYLSAEAASAVAQTLSEQAGEKKPELSDRETAVLRGVAEGLSYKQIADRLGIGTKSVETYRARLVKKTGCSTRADLVRYAIREGISAL